MAHKELMDKLNELNLYRESSNTLRNEARQAQSQLAEKTQRVEELLGQIQPLETRILELENARETQDGEILLLQEDRDRWQKRTQDIISKYDRIDPAEMEQLKESITTLQAERDALIAEQQPLREQAQSFEEEKKRWQQSREKLIEQSKNRNREQNKTIADRGAERDAALQDKSALEGQLSTLHQELETALQEKGDAEQRLESLRDELETVKFERDEAAATLGTSGPSENISQDTASVETLAAIQQELETTKQIKEALEKELEAVRADLDAARQQLESVKVERDQALAKAAVLPAQTKSNESAKEDAEEGQINEGGPTTLSDGERQALEGRAVAAETRVKELEEKVAEMEGSMEATIKARSDKMKTALNKKLAESKETIRTELGQEYETKLAQDKAIWMAENATSFSTGPIKDSSTPNTPQKPNGDTEKSATISLPTLSDAQVRDLLATNPTIKSILASNIKKKLEAETQKIKEESETKIAEAEQAATQATQKLADSERKAEDAKAQAVAMESKRSSVKLNMTENRLKQTSAKLQVVENAANDTPEKPVGEVWEVAKLAKPSIPAPVTNKGMYS